MASYTRREVTVTSVEFSLPSPCPAAEMGKAYAAAERELKASGVEVYDDTILIEARDEELVLFYVRTGRARP